MFIMICFQTDHYLPKETLLLFNFDSLSCSPYFFFKFRGDKFSWPNSFALVKILNLVIISIKFKGQKFWSCSVKPKILLILFQMYSDVYT